MPLPILIAMWLVSSSFACTEFSSAPVTPSVPAAVVSAAAPCDLDCALKCSAAEPAACSAFAFLPQSKLCLMSAAKDADFSAAAPDIPVFRRRTHRQSYVTVGGRQFRIIQHRSRGDLSFARSWADYATGFGDGTDFWIGLETIHELTGNSPKLLRVEAVTWWNILAVSEYSGFSVGGASTSYSMTLGSYLSGSSNMTEDSLTYHKGMKFSTMDRDNDADSTKACSNHYGNGGWWFRKCFGVNPNGIYRYYPVSDTKAMVWKGATSGSHIALKSIRLMLQMA